MTSLFAAHLEAFPFLLSGEQRQFITGQDLKIVTNADFAHKHGSPLGSSYKTKFMNRYPFTLQISK
jgi:hypothetical protein